MTKTVVEGRELGAKGRTTVTVVGPDAAERVSRRDRDRSDFSSLFGDHSVTCARPGHPKTEVGRVSALRLIRSVTVPGN